jgi:hypothetical protein
MAKKNFNNGINRVFSSTGKEKPITNNELEITKTEERVEAGEVLPLPPPEGDNRGSRGSGGNGKAGGDVVVSYNIRYSKELQKRIKRFCIENDGVDMKDVFTEGAVMYMERYND